MAITAVIKTPRSIEKGMMIFPVFHTVKVMTLSYKIPSILLSNIDWGIIPYSMNWGIIQARSNQYFIEWQIVTLLSSATIRFGGLRHHSQKLAVSPFPVGSNFAAKHVSEVLHFLGMFWHFLLFSELESMRILGMLCNCVCLTGSFGYVADNAIKWLNIFLLTTCSLNT